MKSLPPRVPEHRLHTCDPLDPDRDPLHPDSDTSGTCR